MILKKIVRVTDNRNILYEIALFLFYKNHILINFNFGVNFVQHHIFDLIYSNHNFDPVYVFTSLVFRVSGHSTFFAVKLKLNIFKLFCLIFGRNLSFTLSIELKSKYSFLHDVSIGWLVEVAYLMLCMLK